MPFPKKTSYKRANLAKARERRRKTKAAARKVQGFLPALLSEDPAERCLRYYPKFTRKGHSKAQRRATLEASAIPLQPAVCDAAVQAVSDEEKAHDVILANLAKVIFQGFTQNTSERRRLVSKLSKGIPKALASKILGVSPKMIQRGNADLISDTAYQLGQAQPKQKRQKMDPIRHQLANHLLDSLSPVRSGRDWRVMRCTEKHLYEKYTQFLQQCFPEQVPVSRSYFIERVLDKKTTNQSTMKMHLTFVLNVGKEMNLLERDLQCL